MNAALLPVLLVAVAHAAPAPTTFPVPSGAQDVRHFVLADAEQDDFWLDAEYPSTPALSHYARVFQTWRRCRGSMDSWQSYGDVAGARPEFVRIFARYWVNPANDRAVVVIFQYRTPTDDVRRAPPAGHKQHVTVVQYRGASAAEELAPMQVECPPTGARSAR